MTAVMALSLLAGGAVQASALSAQAAKTAEPAAAVSEENGISGNWKRAADPALTDTVRKVFDKAFDGLEGVSYTPYALLACWPAAPPAPAPSTASCARPRWCTRARRRNMWWPR